MQQLAMNNGPDVSKDVLDLPPEFSRHKSSGDGLKKNQSEKLNYQIVKGAQAVGDALNIYGFTDLSTPYAKKNSDSDSDDSSKSF